MSCEVASYVCKDPCQHNHSSLSLLMDSSLDLQRAPEVRLSRAMTRFSEPKTTTHVLLEGAGWGWGVVLLLGVNSCHDNSYLLSTSSLPVSVIIK